jgi:hypothetical protein
MRIRDPVAKEVDRMTNFTSSPDCSALPAPTDDGAARHLVGMRLPSIALAATDGGLNGRLRWFPVSFVASGGGRSRGLGRRTS